MKKVIITLAIAVSISIHLTIAYMVTSTSQNCDYHINLNNETGKVDITDKHGIKNSVELDSLSEFINQDNL